MCNWSSQSGRGDRKVFEEMTEKFPNLIEESQRALRTRLMGGGKELYQGTSKSKCLKP